MNIEEKSNIFFRSTKYLINFANLLFILKEDWSIEIWYFAACCITNYIILAWMGKVAKFLIIKIILIII